MPSDQPHKTPPTCPPSPTNGLLLSTCLSENQPITASQCKEQTSPSHSVTCTQCTMSDVYQGCCYDITALLCQIICKMFHENLLLEGVFALGVSLSLTCGQLTVGPASGGGGFRSGGEGGTCAAGPWDGQGHRGHGRRVQLQQRKNDYFVMLACIYREIMILFYFFTKFFPHLYFSEFRFNG